MKTSELIEKLQASLEKNGDLEVAYHDDYKPFEVEHADVTVLSEWGEAERTGYLELGYVDEDFYCNPMGAHDCFTAHGEYYCDHRKWLVIY